MSKPLGSYEGRPEVASKIQITKAGDGLSAPLRAEPKGFSLDEEVFVILRTSVGKLTHLDASEGDGVVRLHVLDTLEATIVDRAVVEGALAEQRKIVELLLQREAAAKGAIPFPPVDGEGGEGDEGEPADPAADGDLDDEGWEASARAADPVELAERRKGKGKKAGAQ